jgi:amino acid transporter
LRVLKRLSDVSVLWHFLATTSLVIAVLAKAPTHQSGKFVFRTFVDATGLDGVGWSQRASTAYVGVIGSLFAQYGLTGRSTRRVVRMDIHSLTDRFSGFDAGAYMIEETRNASIAGPIGIILSIVAAAILGWILTLGFLFSIQDYTKTVASPTGLPVLQIFLDTLGENGAIALMVSGIT